MNRADLNAVGEYLYGKGWRTPLAKALGISEVTVRAYDKGRRRINDGVANDICKLAARRQFLDALPILENIIEHNKIYEIELKVYGNDSGDKSIHTRPWSFECDKCIKTYVAEMIKAIGIPAVVEKV